MSESPTLPVLVQGNAIAVHFPIRRGLLRRVVGHVRAVDGVTIELRQGETLGLVGESGSGKSTLGRVLLRLLRPTTGSVHFDARDITSLKPPAMRAVRSQVQVVFQDPYSSMSPLSTVADSMEEPLRTHRPDMSSADRAKRISELLTLVGLDPSMRTRYPREFSGGQLQRIAIARALALEPRVIVLDEPVSSLDVSIQADVINLLKRLQRDLGLTYLFIAHDLALVRHISDRIAVMYLGRIVEIGPAAEVYERPKHPYTQALLSAIPVPNPQRQRSRQRIMLQGDIPSPANPPPGCRFHTRCQHVMETCKLADPQVFDAPDGTAVSCHLHTAGPCLSGDSVLRLGVGSGGNRAENRP